jgi:hypothetical protein
VNSQNHRTTFGYLENIGWLHNQKGHICNHFNPPIELLIGDLQLSSCNEKLVRFIGYHPRQHFLNTTNRNFSVVLAADLYENIFPNNDLMKISFQMTL